MHGLPAALAAAPLVPQLSLAQPCSQTGYHDPRPVEDASCAAEAARSAQMSPRGPSARRHAGRTFIKFASLVRASTLLGLGPSPVGERLQIML